MYQIFPLNPYSVEVEGIEPFALSITDNIENVPLVAVNGGNSMNQETLLKIIQLIEGLKVSTTVNTDSMMELVEGETLEIKTLVGLLLNALTDKINLEDSKVVLSEEGTSISI